MMENDLLLVVKKRIKDKLTNILFKRKQKYQTRSINAYHIYNWVYNIIIDLIKNTDGRKMFEFCSLLGRKIKKRITWGAPLWQYIFEHVHHITIGIIYSSNELRFSITRWIKITGKCTTTPSIYARNFRFTFVLY